jgi:hypothetical protein
MTIRSSPARPPRHVDIVQRRPASGQVRRVASAFLPTRLRKTLSCAKSGRDYPSQSATPQQRERCFCGVPPLDPRPLIPDPTPHPEIRHPDNPDPRTLIGKTLAKSGISQQNATRWFRRISRPLTL